MSDVAIVLRLSLTDRQCKDLQRFHEITEDNQGYDIPADRMKSLARAALIQSLGFSRYGLTDNGVLVVESLNRDKQREEKQAAKALDERLTTAGMTEHE